MVPANLPPWIFSGHLTPKWSQIGARNRLRIQLVGGSFLDRFWTTFGYFGGPFSGPFWDQIGPRRSQDGSKRAIENFKDPKSCICKNLKKQLVFQCFWGPEASQDEHKRLKKAPKRHLKSFKTSKKGSKNGTDKNIF